MMICKTFGETTPLLLYSSPSVKAKFCQDKEGCHVSYSNTSVSQARPVGPLDITPQRRRLVLTGVWLGVFLAVSYWFSPNVNGITHIFFFLVVEW